MLVDRMRATGDRGELYDRLDQTGGAANDAEIVDPLRAGVEARLLAVGHGLA